MSLIDQEIARLDAIELQRNIPFESTASAKAALYNLKQRMEDDAEIGRQLLAAIQN
jgi:hypothetical protein